MVFLDPSYLLAIELANDQNHQSAAQHWQRVVAALPPLVTTSYVFDEVVTFFNNRGHHAKAVEVGNGLLLSPSVRLILSSAQASRSSGICPCWISTKPTSIFSRRLLFV